MKKLYRMAALAGAALIATSLMASTPTETTRMNQTPECSGRALNLHKADKKKQSSTRGSSYLNQDYDNYTWLDLGMAKYREDIILSIMYLNGYDGDYYDVPIQEAREVPGLYRLVNPYGEYFPAAQYVEGDPEISNYDPTVTEYLYLHCEEKDDDGACTSVWMDTLDSQFHSTQEKLGNYHMSSYAYTYYLEQGYSLDEARMANRTGWMRDGAIAFPVNGLIVALDGYYMEDGRPRWLGANIDGTFSVIVPGGINYELSALPEAVCAKDNKVKVKFYTGPDIKVKYGLVKARLNIMEIDEYALEVEKNGTLVDNDDMSAVVNVPEGLHTLVAVSIDNAGYARYASICTVYGIDNSDNWISLGNTTWHEDFIPTFFSTMESEEMECEIQMRKDTKMVRLVNPYAKHPKRDEFATHPTDHNHYMNILIERSDRCEIPYCTVDCGYEGNAMIVGDFVQYWRDNTDYDDDRIAKEGTFGWIEEKDGKHWLRFNGGYLTARFGNDTAYWLSCNITGEPEVVNDNTDLTSYGDFRVLLPMDKINDYKAGLNGIFTSEEAPAVYYNLQGQRVETPAAGSVVIKKQGAKVTKEIF